MHDWHPSWAITGPATTTPRGGPSPLLLMRAIILAAGQGLRLQQAKAEHVPKVLLQFAGKSLLERHLLLLKQCGVAEVVLALGFGDQLVQQELDRLAWQPRPEITFNGRYTEGSMLTLALAAGAMTRGGEVLLMDGDVLYDSRLVGALVNGLDQTNRLLMDRNFEAGEEPVKICLQAGVPVEFGKRIGHGRQFDVIGESVGFFRFSEPAARRLAAIAQDYVLRGHTHLPHEEAVRDWLMEGSQAVDVCDVTGLPWIEIDFPTDVARAHGEILAQLAPLTAP